MLQEKEQLNLQLAEMSILLRIKQDVGEQDQNQQEGKDVKLPQPQWHPSGHLSNQDTSFCHVEPRLSEHLWAQ